MNGDLVLQLEAPLDLIKNQDIYVIGSCDGIGYLKIVGLAVSVNSSTRKFRNTISRELLRDNEIKLVLPINGYTHLRINHMNNVLANDNRQFKVFYQNTSDKVKTKGDEIWLKTEKKRKPI